MDSVPDFDALILAGGESVGLTARTRWASRSRDGRFSIACWMLASKRGRSSRSARTVRRRAGFGGFVKILPAVDRPPRSPPACRTAQRTSSRSSQRTCRSSTPQRFTVSSKPLQAVLLESAVTTAPFLSIVRVATSI